MLGDVIERGNPLALGVLALLVHWLFYSIPNQFPLFAPRTLPLTGVDRAVPFLPWTVWIYFSDYVLMFVGLVSTRAPGGRTRFALTFFSVLGIATFTHWLIPTAYPRLLFPLPEHAGALTRLGVALLRDLDSPLSCFPSLHVATSLIAALSVLADGARRRGWVLFVWAVLVAASTLTTKQHYAVDVVAGAALGTVLHVIFHFRARVVVPSQARASAPPGTTPLRASDR